MLRDEVFALFSEEGKGRQIISSVLQMLLGLAGAFKELGISFQRCQLLSAKKLLDSLVTIAVRFNEKQSSKSRTVAGTQSTGLQTKMYGLKAIGAHGRGDIFC